MHAMALMILFRFILVLARRFKLGAGEIAMDKTFIPLIEKQKLFNGYRKVFSVNKMELLLIYINDKTYLLENKCGHFGVSLEDGQIEQLQTGDIIICKQHGISFDLSTGNVVNRHWENCNPVVVLDVVLKEDIIGFYV